MLGLPSEEWKRSQHMLTALPLGYAIVTAAAADGSSTSSSLHSANSFIKDGRKISVGDCALFKPPEDCPPFIGIIRLLSVGEDNKLSLGVNWLYRPAEVKLCKGVLLEATPNEIFYSFHRDEIPSASLLHPCRVAFLPNGIELPPGTSSFVCRRVYDTTNKCLWWLTDQDYINEHQEEVNHLLNKTQVKMHAAGQPGGRSPKTMNSTSSASPLKVGSDTVQNSTPNIHSQVKGKKRERVEPGTEHLKRKHTIKTDDGDCGPCRHGSILKIELTKIIEKGRLIESEGVEKLVQLMIPDKNEKINLADWSTLAGVIEATDKFDCLSQFVQLKGLLVFDEWLQEIHKGKIGDVSGPKDSDKLVEEFLLVLLSALDKLPVNLQALQMCNIGKSVNHLRSHKNLEIQKRARGLVDTWKKRVEAEMNMNDAKSGLNQTVNWPVRPQLLEVSQGVSRQLGISSEVAVRSSVSHLSASKAISSKTVQEEGTSRPSSDSASSPNSSKMLPPPASADANVKEWKLRGAILAGTSDLPLATIKGEKISGSSNCHYGQSFSVEQTKAGALSGKDGIRISASATITANKKSAGPLRHRKPSNGLPVMNPSRVLKEAGTTKFSVDKDASSDKLSQPGVVYEKAPEGTSVEGNSNNLIVRTSNHGQNPARDASSSFLDDPSLIKSRTSSPFLSEKANLSDRSVKDKVDLSSDTSGTDDVDGSHAVISNDSENIVVRAKVTLSTFGNKEKTCNLQDSSSSTMNSLIESCVKYSESNATLSAVDAAGMNLLASVAAGEVSKSHLATLIRSPQSITVEESDLGNKAEAKYPNEGSQDHNHPSDSDNNKKNGSDEVCHDLGVTNVDGKSAALASEEKPTGEKNKHGTNSSQELQQTKEDCLDRQETVDEKPPDTLVPVLAGAVMDEVTSRGGGGQLCEISGLGKIEEGGNDGKPLLGSSMVEVEIIGKSTLNTNLDVDVKERKCSIERFNSGSQTELKSLTELQFQSTQGGDKHVSCNSCHRMGKIRDNVELKAENSEQFNAKTFVTDAKIYEPEQEENTVLSTNSRVLMPLASGISDQDAERVGDNLAKKEADDQLDGQILCNDSPAHQSIESELELGSKESKMTAMEAQEAEECSSTTTDASSRSAARISDGDGKVEFDFNEGLNAGDQKCLDMNSTSILGYSNPIQLISPVPFSASGVPDGLSASITVATAAKGPFLPPKDLLKNKTELGWKGPAATSAFRPAEPRKVTEMSLHPSSIPVSNARARKQSLPLLDVDLNVAYERMLGYVSSQSFTLKDDSLPLPKDVPEPAHDKVLTSAAGWCSGRIDLDLNEFDETPELGRCLKTSSHITNVPVTQSKPSSDGPLNSGTNHRDFDLNDRPAIDEGNGDPLVYNQLAKISVPYPPPIPGFRMGDSEIGNFSSGFPATGNTYSPITLSSIMSDGGDQPFPVISACRPQRVPGPCSSASLFSPDVFRGPVPSSSPTVPFPSGPFQYPFFHVGPNFPPAASSLIGTSANCVDPSSGGRFSFPTANQQLFGTAVSCHYPRPYSESSRKWERKGLDLNAGPGGSDVEGRDDNVSLTLRQLSVGSSQSLAEENTMMLQMSGNILKRKEPEGGWDGFKQSSWL